MLIAVDIGNTNIHIGVASEGTLGGVRLFPTVEWGSAKSIQAMLSETATGEPEAVILSSVVREASDRTEAATLALWKETTFIRATPALPLGVVSEVQPADTVGVDRLIAAGEAHAAASGAAIVIGMGTAMTVDGVSAEGRFVGGTISPGLRTQLRSLKDRTSLLPDVELADPGKLPGSDTRSSILGGVVYGTAGSADRLVEELRAVEGADAEVLVTGGDAGFVSPYLRSRHRVIEHLVLRGLVSTYGRLRTA